MTPPDSTIDFPRLVATAQDLGRAIGVEAIAPVAVEERIRAILRERFLLEAVNERLVTEREAASALLSRVMTWMLGSRAHPGLADYGHYEQEAIEALFGQRRAASKASM